MDGLGFSIPPENMADKPVMFWRQSQARKVVESDFASSTLNILEHGSNGREAAVCARSSGSPLPDGAMVDGRLVRSDRAPDCDRSGREAGAVRDRSFRLPPRPVAIGWPVRVRRGLGYRTRYLDPDPLTIQDDGWPISVPKRGRVAVPTGTAEEPRWNHHLSEIISFSVRFQRFQLGASRDAHVYVHEHTRTHTRGPISGTLEPLDYISINQLVNGSREVPKRFQLGTVSLALAVARRKAGDFNKLGGGYCLGFADCVDRGGSSTVMRGRAAQTFGRRALGRADRADQAGSSDVGGDAGRNGGFLPFVGGQLARVGRAMLEGMAQGRGFACLGPVCQLPVSLRHRLGLGDPWGASTPWAPPRAPFAAAPSPSMLAHERGRIWIGFAPLNLGASASPPVGRQDLDGSSGRGGRSLEPQTRKNARVGERKFSCHGGLRRRAHGRTEASRVN